MSQRRRHRRVSSSTPTEPLDTPAVERETEVISDVEEAEAYELPTRDDLLAVPERALPAVAGYEAPQQERRTYPPRPIWTNGGDRPERSQTVITPTVEVEMDKRVATEAYPDPLITAPAPTTPPPADDAQLRENFEQAVVAATRATKVIRAKKAELEGRPYMSFLSEKQQKDRDELNGLWSTMAQLPAPGWMSVYQVSARPGNKHEFSGPWKKQLDALKDGQPPKSPLRERLIIMTVCTIVGAIVGGWLYSKVANQVPPGILLGSLIGASIGLSPSWASYLVKYFVWLGGGKNRGKLPPERPVSKGEKKAPPPKSQSDEDRLHIREAERKVRDGSRHWDTRARLAVIAPIPEKIDEDFKEAKEDAAEQADDFVHRMTAQLGAFETEFQGLRWVGCDGRELFGYHPARRDKKDPVLSPTELGELARPADKDTKPAPAKLKRAVPQYDPLEQPVIVPDPLNPPAGVLPLGYRNRGSEDEHVVGIEQEVTDTHMFISGQTGTGKSVLAEWLVFGQAKATKIPLVLVAPHAELARNLTSMLVQHAPERLKDVVLLDPGNDRYSLALNPLAVEDDAQVPAAVGAVMELLRVNCNLSAATAPRATPLAATALTALAEASLSLSPENKPTVLSLADFLLDRDFRQIICQLSDDPGVHQAFNVENGTFEIEGDGEKNKILGPIVNRLATLANDRSFGRIFASPQNRFDIPAMLAEGKIIILETGSFTEGAKLGRFIGSLILPSFLAGIPKFGRQKDEDYNVTGTGASLIVDEAPALYGSNDEATAAQIESATAQMRKYGGNLVLIAQNPEQLKMVKSAVYGNMKHKIALQHDPMVVGGLGLSLSKGQSKIRDENIASLPNFTAYVSTEVQPGRKDTGPFLVSTLEPVSYRLSDDQKALRASLWERSHKAYYNDADAMWKRRRSMKQDIIAELHKKLGAAIQAQAEEEMEGTGAGQGLQSPERGQPRRSTGRQKSAPHRQAKRHTASPAPVGDLDQAVDTEYEVAPNQYEEENGYVEPLADDEFPYDGTEPDIDSDSIPDEDAPDFLPF